MHSHTHAHHHGHGQASRRDFLQRALGGAMAGASVLEMGFFRAAVARAQSATATQKLFDIEKVADGVYFALAHPAALTNCNAAIFVNSQDGLVVDAHSKPSAAASLIAQIKKEVTPKPVRYLVNTHFHWDHTQGDPAYKATGSKVEIIASEATKELLAQNARKRLKDSLDGMPQMIDGLQARLARASSAQDKEFWQEQIRQAKAYQAEMRDYMPELPDITFKDSHVIKDSAHDLHIEFHGRAHTAGDVQVFVPQKRVVASGDAIIGWLPNVADGYPREWPATINSVGKLAVDHILPGHGPVQAGRERMTQFRNYIEELTAAIEKGKKAGQPLAEVRKTVTPASLKTWQAGGFGDYVAGNLNKLTVYAGARTPVEDRFAANVETIYNNLDRT